MATDAAALVSVHYEPLPLLLDTKVASVAHEEWTESDGEQELARCPNRLRRTLRNQCVAAVPLETLACPAGGGLERLTLWATIQLPPLSATVPASCSAWPMHRLRVVAPAACGGFGAKAELVRRSE